MVRRGAARIFLVLLFLCAGPLFAAVEQNSSDLAWPPLTRTAKPWTYWWWMGSAVEKAELSRALELYANTGLGGVHIIPVYGVQGWEDRYIPYLSPAWMETLSYTSAEADRLGLGLDMTTGTGWPFGGPQITPEFAAKSVKIGKHGEHYLAEVTNTGQRVKRAAPGGEGLVMDPFSSKSLEVYLARFDSAFSGYGHAPVRAFYNDSFEVYQADWTTDMFAEFARRRGYDLREHLAALKGIGDPETARRVLCDYRETISDLLLDEFTIPWVQWVHQKGCIARNQAHGSPGNLLDLYAEADAPETEAFGPSRFNLPGLRYYSSAPPENGRPDPLVMKFASSAAHVAGRPLVSSESATWLGEHFTVTLAQVKPELDQLWLAGVNHVFFHGLTYSPASEPWPGWLWYASTNFGPADTMFRHLPALNTYVARTQSFLQAGTPANDLLLYWPIHDLFCGVYDQPKSRFDARLALSLRDLWRGRFRDSADELFYGMAELYDAHRSMVKLFTVHDAEMWFHRTPFGQTAQTLWQRGYTFDYVSDRMIAGLTFDDSLRANRGAAYRALLVPPCRFMPIETLEKLAELARQGATIIFMEGLPGDVPGLGDLPRKRERMKIAKTGLGQALIGNDLESLLSKAGVLRETMTDSGLLFTRRSHDEGYSYFIANPGPEEVDGWIELATRAQSAAIYDPLRETSGVAAVQRGSNGRDRVLIQLAPGQSLILKTFSEREIVGAKWKYLEPAGDAILLRGKWKIEFIEGGPALPPNYETERLESWTQRPGQAYQYFSGAARYSLDFQLPPAPAPPADWVLELGEVRESARVFVNGRDAGAVFCVPYELRIGEYLQPGPNRIVIEVANLPANRIIYMDRRREKWKKFHDVNFVNLSGLPFSAALWPPYDSGLIGPVTLRAMEEKN